MAMSTNQTYPQSAMIVLNGWGGLFEQRVQVVGETPTRYRILAGKEDVRLAGRRRYLRAGATGLVPKHAVMLLG